jgi:hypothetical protein
MQFLDLMMLHPYLAKVTIEIRGSAVGIVIGCG